MCVCVVCSDYIKYIKHIKDFNFRERERERERDVHRVYGFINFTTRNI